MKLFVYSAVITMLIVQQMTGMAQIPKIDSLKQVLVHEKGEQRIEVLIQLTMETARGGNDAAAAPYINEAMALVPLLRDSAKIVRVYRVNLILLQRLGLYDELVPLAEKIIPVAMRNNYDYDLKYIFNCIALAYTFMGIYDKALDYHFQSLQIRESTGISDEVSVTLINMGLLYYKMSNFKMALNYYERAVKIKLTEKDYYSIDRLHINMGLCYQALGKFKEARDFIEKGLSFCRLDCTNAIKMEAEYALGSAALEEKDFDVALQFFERSLVFARNEGDTRYEAENLIGISKVLIHKKKLNEVESLLKEVERIADKDSYHQILLDTYKQFTNLYMEKGAYKALSIYQSKYIEARERIYSEALMANLGKLQGEFQERVHLQTISSQKQVLALQESALRQQRFLNITIGCIVVLFALVIVLLYKGNRNKRKINHLLDVKVHERTQELQSNQELLQQAYNDLQLFVRSTSASIHGPLATIKGVCYVAEKDIRDPMVLKYFQSLTGAAEQLTTIVANMQQPEAQASNHQSFKNS